MTNPISDNILKEGLALEPKLHWFLVSYYFKPKEGPNGMGNMRAGRVNRDLREVDLAEIRDKTLKMHPNFDSLAILNISHLGYMTKTEFYKGSDK